MTSWDPRATEAYHPADPFPHVIVDDFLSPDLIERLAGEFPAFERGARLDESGKPGEKGTYERIRELGPAYAELDDLLRSAPFLDWLGQITGVPALLYDPDYIGGGTHENRSGQELDPHVDFNYHPTRGWHRRLNLLLYLNPVWEESWGGCLELHSDPWAPDANRVKTILPVWNRCVIFETSERSWHGFRAVLQPPGPQARSRRSVAVYFYTRERPVDQIAPPHATVYVPRPLPDQLAPGAVLTEADREQIHTLLTRRSQHTVFLVERERRLAADLADAIELMLDHGAAPMPELAFDSLRRLVALHDEQLQSLYRRETAFTGALERLGARHEPRSPHPPFVLRGGLRSAGDVVGGWEDGWVGRRLRLLVTSDTGIGRLRLRGHLPAQHGGGRELTFLTPGQCTTRRIEAGEFEWIVPLALAAEQVVAIEIRCAPTWSPSRAQRSEDVRELGYQLLEIAAL